jgi:hypothetical protein
VRVEVAQRHDAQQLAPARVAAPRVGGPRAAGDHDERAGGEPGHELLAQPVLERARCLERVEQQDRPVGVEAGGARELGGESGWRRLDPAQVEQDRRPAGGAGGLGERGEQRRLADAAGAADPQNAERRLGRLERGAEQLQLGRAAHEPAPARASEPVGDGRVLGGDPGHQMRPGTEPNGAVPASRAAACRGRG